MCRIFYVVEFDTPAPDVDTVCSLLTEHTGLTVVKEPFNESFYCYFHTPNKTDNYHYINFSYSDNKFCFSNDDSNISRYSNYFLFATIYILKKLGGRSNTELPHYAKLNWQQWHQINNTAISKLYRVLLIAGFGLMILISVCLMMIYLVIAWPVMLYQMHCSRGFNRVV